MFRKLAFVSFFIFILAAAVFAASSATISFDTIYGTDQPEYPISASGLTNDDSGCDRVTMLMTDANGLITDIDNFCIDIVTGLGSDSTSWWSYDGASGDPTLGPITYSLYDTGAADPCSSAENSVACANYLASGEVSCIAENYYQPPSLPAGSPVHVCSFAGTCIPIPAGSVVGDLPFSTQAYYSPGNLAQGVVLNPGTYWVIGQDESAQYYKIILSCQYLWVPVNTMQPSYQQPQNGAPLPTRVVS